MLKSVVQGEAGRGKVWGKAKGGERVVFFDVDYILTMTSGRFPFFLFWVSIAVSPCLPRVKGDRRGTDAGGSSLAVPEHSPRWLVSPKR